MAMLYKKPEGNNDYTIMLEILKKNITKFMIPKFFSKWLHDTRGLSSSCRRGVFWCFERCLGASTAVGTGAGDLAGLLIEWIQWADAEWCFILWSILIYDWYIIDIWLIYYDIFQESLLDANNCKKKVVSCDLFGERGKNSNSDGPVCRNLLAFRRSAALSLLRPVAWRHVQDSDFQIITLTHRIISIHIIL